MGRLKLREGQYLPKVTQHVTAQMTRGARTLYLCLRQSSSCLRERGRGGLSCRRDPPTPGSFELPEKTVFSATPEGTSEPGATGLSGNKPPREWATREQPGRGVRVQNALRSR